MAIKHDFGEAGLSEWLTWSERSPKFELQEALETWASFKDKTPGRKITLGSIFHVAQALGWNREGTEKIPEHIARLNQNYFLAQRGGKTLIFKEGIDPCDGRPMLQAMKIPDFRPLFSNEFVDSISAQGKPIRISIANAWLTHSKRRQYDGVVLAPNREIAGYPALTP